MGGNFKVKCLNNNGFDELYTIGKIYEIKNGIFENDYMVRIISVNEIEDLNRLTSATWKLIEEEGENKMKDLRKLIKPCMVIVRENGRVCGTFLVESGIRLQESLGCGCCLLSDYDKNLEKGDGEYNIIKIYGINYNSFDISTESRPLIWERIKKSPRQLEIESIESEQRKLADRLSKLKEGM